VLPEAMLLSVSPEGSFCPGYSVFLGEPAWVEGVLNSVEVWATVL
jgi:hypothetical protein